MAKLVDVSKCKEFLSQLFHNPNFMWFTCLSFVQTLHCHFNSNFFPMFLTVLLGDYLSPFMQSVVSDVVCIASLISLPSCNLL